jgi:hypothetical protein
MEVYCSVQQIKDEETHIKLASLRLAGTTLTTQFFAFAFEVSLPTSFYVLVVRIDFLHTIDFSWKMHLMNLPFP